MAQELRSCSRGGWSRGCAGQFAGCLSTPFNLVGMAGGACEASTIARAVLREAAINASLTAAEEPSKMIARAKRCGDTSLGEVVSDIALSAGVGAVGGAFFKGTEKAGRAILSRVRTPDRKSTRLNSSH